MTTPNKICISSSVLSPIRFKVASLNSPSNIKSPKSIISTVNQKLLIKIKQLLSNHEKWTECQKRGILICNAIERTKSKVFESSTKVKTLYPDELNSLCTKLNSLVEIFKSILNYCYEVKKQLEALMKLNENPEEPLFKTWLGEDFIIFIDKLIYLYSAELQIKTIVSENIAHSTTKSSLVLHGAVWEYPQYVNAKSELLFMIIKSECF